MDARFEQIAELLILPPGGPIVLLVLALFVFARRRRFAWLLSFIAMFGMYVPSTPWFVDWMYPRIATYAALDVQTLPQSGAQAIVALGAGRYYGAPEYGGDSVGMDTLARLRYAARLARQSGLPLLVNGDSKERGLSLAELSRDVVQNEFGVPVHWVEPDSRTTQENADFAARLLLPRGVKTIVLVTHAIHMPRSVAVFEKAGFAVVPAPTLLAGDLLEGEPWRTWLPDAGSLSASRLLLHEWLGSRWYELRGWFSDVLGKL